MKAAKMPLGDMLWALKQLFLYYRIVSTNSNCWLPFAKCSSSWRGRKHGLQRECAWWKTGWRHCKTPWPKPPQTYQLVRTTISLTGTRAAAWHLSSGYLSIACLLPRWDRELGTGVTWWPGAPGAYIHSIKQEPCPKKLTTWGVQCVGCFSCLSIINQTRMYKRGTLSQ